MTAARVGDFVRRREDDLVRPTWIPRGTCRVVDVFGPPGLETAVIRYPDGYGTTINPELLEPAEPTEDDLYAFSLLALKS